MKDESESQALAPRRLAHPWHGIRPDLADGRLLVFVENTRHDRMKLEVDVRSGYLRVDHPLQDAVSPPYAYGFVPRTLCGRRLAGLSAAARGDQAPLDVFVLSEQPIPLPGVLAEIRLVGGIAAEDEDCVDDKLIGILHNDPAMAAHENIDSLPVPVIEAITRFIATTSLNQSTRVGEPFGVERAREILQASFDDYQARFGI